MSKTSKLRYNNINHKISFSIIFTLSQASLSIPLTFYYSSDLIMFSAFFIIPHYTASSSLSINSSLHLSILLSVSSMNLFTVFLCPLLFMAMCFLFCFKAEICFCSMVSSFNQADICRLQNSLTLKRSSTYLDYRFFSSKANYLYFNQRADSAW